MSIQARLFLVGAPRSGTTLLQSLLTAHPQIYSVPESDFFARLNFRKRLWRYTLEFLNIAPHRARRRVKEILEEVEGSDTSISVPQFLVFKEQCIQAFISSLDSLAQERNKTVWLEKTPRHLHYIDKINQFVPEAKFIHILRSGADVVASQVEASQQHPDTWGQRTIDHCIQRWIKDIRTSQRYADQPNHRLVRYEDVVEDPQTQLTQLCQFIGIPFDERMLTDYSTASEKLIRKKEVWKASVKEQIRNANSRKFKKVFSEAEQDYILACLAQEQDLWVGA
jgi:hypothetical protein